MRACVGTRKHFNVCPVDVCVCVCVPHMATNLGHVEVSGANMCVDIKCVIPR